MKKCVIGIVFLLSLGLFAQGPEALFKEANTFYKEGNYERAIGVYLSIEEQGYWSADLFFNLGNSYYKLNKVAPSIYYYEKALKLDPLHEDTLFNLPFAQRMTIDIIEDLPKSVSERFSEAIIEKLHYDTWASIAVAASFLAALMFLLYYFSGSSNKKLFYFNSFLFSMFVMVVTVFFAFSNFEHAQKNRHAIIFEASVEVLNAPTQTSDEAFELHEGTKVQVLDELENWKKIKIRDGKIGWILDTALKEI